MRSGVGIFASAHVVPGGSTVYTDDFNRANGALAAPWVTPEGNHSIVSNAVAVGASSPNISYYTGTFANDQWVEADIAGLVSGLTTISVCVRYSGGNLYYLWVDGSFHTQIFKRVGGTYTQVGSTGALSAQNAKVALGVQGTTLRTFVNGVVDVTATDSALASGSPGIISANGAGATLDNWRGGSGVYPGPVVFADNFNRADTTQSGGGVGGVGLGANWTAASWAIQSNKAAKVGGSGDYAVAHFDTGSDDNWSEADTVIGNSVYAVMNARRPSATDDSVNATGYLGFIQPDGSATSLGKSINGAYQDIGSWGPGPAGFVQGVSVHKLRLEVQGTTIRLYVDNILKVTATDSSIVSGHFCGFNANVVSFDNFRCGALPWTP
jgi:hypothetical protein